MLRQEGLPLIDELEPGAVAREQELVAQLEAATLSMAHQIERVHVAIAQVPLPHEEAHVGVLLRPLHHALLGGPLGKRVSDGLERRVEAARVAHDDEVETPLHFHSVQRSPEEPRFWVRHSPTTVISVITTSPFSDWFHSRCLSTWLDDSER